MIRKYILLLAGVIALSGVCSAQGIMHGIGDPRTLTPVPNCSFSRFYIDDSNQHLYLASSGSPCAWVDPGGFSNTGFAYASSALKCDGVTDDTTAFQAQVTAAESAGTVLVLPPNKTCVLTSTINVTGVVLWQGNNSTLALSPTVPKQEMFVGSNVSRLDIGGITFQGNSNTVAGFFIAGGTNTNFNFHNNTFTGITGCPVSPNTWTNAAIMMSGVTDVTVWKNKFLASGCSNYWQTSGPTGMAVTNLSSLPSYGWDVSGNTVNNTNAIYGFLFFNLFESTIHDNDIKNVALGGAGGGDDADSSGYGIAIYGAQICGEATLASPSGLSRTSNVVTFNFISTCSPALVPGDHFTLHASTSVGGTGFDGTYTVQTVLSSSSVTALVDTGMNLANDTGGGGATEYAPNLDTVHDNRIQNTAGMGIYLQGLTDSTATNNVFKNVCQSMNDGSLPCGFVSAGSSQRIAIGGNSGAGSVKDGIITANGVGISSFGNNVSGVTSSGLRMRGTDTSEAWFGNTVNGANFGLTLDGGATANVGMGNAIVGANSDHIAVNNAGDIGNIFVANNLNSLGFTSNPAGIINSAGPNNVFALNFLKSFRGNAFDLRANFPLVALNYLYAGSGVALATSTASYARVTGNYLYQVHTAINDSGTSNVYADNYLANTGATLFINHNGLYWGNHFNGGNSGVYPVGSCTLVAGTCTVTNLEVLSTDNGSIYCTRGSTGANPGFPFVSSITAATSFVVTSTSATDTGNVSCRIQH